MTVSPTSREQATKQRFTAHVAQVAPLRHVQAIYLRSELIEHQAPDPGVRHSQKVQPFTGPPVIVIAAPEGDVNVFQFKWRAPSSTFANIICPL